MQSQDFENAVLDRWGDECVICTRRPEEWNRTQESLSFHHVNGDDTDDRVENIIPVCQSCHIHIHRVDKPPYRKWHRQLPIEHRNAWNQYHHEYYEGPRLTREEAEHRHSDEGGIPESIKYLKREREGFDPSIFESADETSETDETTWSPPNRDEHRNNQPTTSVVDDSGANTKETTADHETADSDGSEPFTESNGLDPELVECPVCGRVGLPERIATHDC